MDFDDLGPVLTLQGDVTMVTADRSRPAEALIEFVQEGELARLAVERERSRALFKSSVTNRSDSAARNAVRSSGQRIWLGSSVSWIAADGRRRNQGRRFDTELEAGKHLTPDEAVA